MMLSEIFDGFWQDLRNAVRVLIKSPGFTAVALLSLMLGVGANTAVFSVVHAVLLRVLPYPDSDRLVRVAQHETEEDISIPEFEFLKEHTSAFSSVAAHVGLADQSIETGSWHEWIKVMTVSGGFFTTLGVAPALGREFQPDETRAGGPAAVVLSDGLWKRGFARDPKVIGRVVKLGEGNYTVVGVLPKTFWFPQAADAFIALRPAADARDRGANTKVIARLKNNVGPKEANAAMMAWKDDFRKLNPDRVSADYRGLTAIPYQDWVVGDVRINLLLLFGAVGMLLLIACSNLASLLLVRLAARHKEIAVRLALGSSRARLLRQFLIENMLLAVTGSLFALLAASWLLDGLILVIPFELPSSAPIHLNLSVMLFTIAMSLGTGLLFGAGSFLRSLRINVNEALKAGNRAVAGGNRQWTRSLLVVSQVALSVTLMVAAALLIQSLYRLHHEDLGFKPEGVLTFWNPPAAGSKQTGAARLHFEQMQLERLHGLPGVHKVAAVNVLPLTDQNNFPAQREGHPQDSIGGMEIRLVTPEYFDALGIPVLRGRGFASADNGTARPVIAVNETLARRWWPKAEPLGDRIILGKFKDQDFPELKEQSREVVGIVADTKTVYLKEKPRPTVYIPSTQAAWMTGGMAWVVRADRQSKLAEQLRQVVWEIDPRQRVERVRTMEDIVSSTTASYRFDAWLFGMFAVVALLLSAIGLYGLLSVSVARRTAEIGTRMALGAKRGDVLALILQQGVGLTLSGLILGLAGAYALTRSLASLLFGVRPTDALSFAAASFLLLVVGGVASYIPARRATRVDPMVALRNE